MQGLPDMLPRWTVLLGLCALVFAASCRSGTERGMSWNDERIAWKGLDEGLREAQATGRPVMLVIYAEWCSHCRNYSRVFSDGSVVAAAKRLVMVRLDAERNRETEARFAPDGKYVPRTLFLTPQGEVMRDVTAQADRFRYFYDEDDPKHVLTAMQKVGSPGRREALPRR